MLKFLLIFILALSLYGGQGWEITKKVAVFGATKTYKTIKESGRKGKQERLKAILNDDKEASRIRGWVQQEVNQIERGKRKNIRVPIGYDLAHQRGKEARKGYGYEYSNLLDKKLHRTQHKYDNNGKKR